MSSATATFTIILAVLLVLLSATTCILAAGQTPQQQQQQQQQPAASYSDFTEDAYECPFAAGVNTILDEQEAAYTSHARSIVRSGSGIINPPASVGSKFDHDVYWSLALSGSIRGLPCASIKAGWWTYELCWGRFLRQYHEEQTSPSKPPEVVAEFLLGWGNAGTVSSDFVLLNRVIRYTDGPHTLARKIPSAVSSPQVRRAFEQAAQFRCTRSLDAHMRRARRRFENVDGVTAVMSSMQFGTVCDVTGKPREVDLVMVCEREEVLFDWNVTESRPCRYTVFVSGRAVCSILRRANDRSRPRGANPIQHQQQQQQQKEQPQQGEREFRQAAGDGDSIAATGPTRYTRDSVTGKDTPPPKGSLTKEAFEKAMMDGDSAADDVDLRVLQKKNQQQQQQSQQQQQATSTTASSSSSSSATDDQQSTETTKREKPWQREAREAKEREEADARRRAQAPPLTELQSEFFDEAMLFGLN